MAAVFTFETRKMAKAFVYLTLVLVLASFVAAINDVDDPCYDFPRVDVAYQEGDPCYASDPKCYGYYAPHPVYCNLFLQCTNGIFRTRSCSPGLHWNPSEGACDWPQSANCQGITSTTTQATTTTTTATTTAE